MAVHSLELMYLHCVQYPLSISPPPLCLLASYWVEILVHCYHTLFSFWFSLEGKPLKAGVLNCCHGPSVVEEQVLRCTHGSHLSCPKDITAVPEPRHQECGRVSHGHSADYRPHVTCSLSFQRLVRSREWK